MVSPSHIWAWKSLVQKHYTVAETIDIRDVYIVSNIYAETKIFTHAPLWTMVGMLSHFDNVVSPI